MSTSEAWTIKRLLEWTTDFLQQYGSETPRLDAEVLLAEAKGCQRIELYTAYDQIPPEEHLAKFRQWVKERAGGKPVAYLVGHREFYSLSFQVNQHVLIPRPETELLVTLAIDWLSESGNEAPQVIDVGTGSGCVAIAIAKNNPNCQLTAVDLSADAIEIAQQNADEHGVAGRIRILQSDLLNDVPEPPLFDLIVSNPPYVGRQEQGTLAREVKDHEPDVALFGGQDGTEVIARLVQQAAKRLRPGGQLLFETSPLIMESCLELTRGVEGLEDVRSHSDLAKHPRVVSAKKSES